MKFSSTIAAIAVCVSGVLAQSPANFTPAASAPLRVTYNSTVVTSGIRLPPSVAASQPLVSYTPSNASATNGTLYQLYMLDLTLPNNSGSAVPGNVANRTVRLHWWQTNLTLSANGSLSPVAGASIGPAPYQGPAPPATDAIAHTYAFYLFLQPVNYSVPANFTSLPGNSTLRNGFNIANAVAAVGQPIAGAYFTASNFNATS